jgi:cysteine desulfurase
MGADLLSISAHKVHGPKGVGALWIQAGTPISPILVGGGQEREMRAGTENVAAIAGFGAAVRAQLGSNAARDARRHAARDAFLGTVAASNRPPVPTLDPATPCLAGHAHLRFPGISAESMLIVLDRMGVCASSGAACSSGSLEPSHVLLACGWTESEAREGLRFTFDDEVGVDAAHEAARRVLAAAAQIGG